MPAVVLSTLNARHSHASLGLRCLRANMAELRDATGLVEFVLGVRAEDAVARILACAPRIVGFGVYIWNVAETTRIVAMLKAVSPDIRVVVGGPEVSHEVEAQRICALADHVVTGWGEVTFANLCRDVLAGTKMHPKVLRGAQPPLAELALPYAEYTDADLAHRNVYVEASRGCPFKCEFCLSALDRTAWPFDLGRFLPALDELWTRGARRFKFVDRTFNLNVRASRAILEFFLQKLEGAPEASCFVHFELVPDHLPQALRETIRRFPAGTLQFEIGVQTFNPDVQARISRRQDNEAAAANLAWLRDETRAHLHVDLIAGLPGEELASFAAGFDRLAALRPHEIQVGILKRLRGAPIDRHTREFGMRYNPEPPYNVLATAAIDFPTLRRVDSFAYHWERIANSGRFVDSLAWITSGDSAFAGFMEFADWLEARPDSHRGMALERLYDDVLAFLVARRGVAPDAAKSLLTADYARSGAHGRLSFAPRGITATDAAMPSQPGGSAPARQARRLGAS